MKILFWKSLKNILRMFFKSRHGPEDIIVDTVDEHFGLEGFEDTAKFVL